MSVVITIAGTDRSEHVETKSVRWSENLTNKADSFSFDIIAHNSFPFSMALKDAVKVTVGGVDVFGGRIISWKDSIEGRPSLLRRTVTCKDYTVDLDKFVHTGRYTTRQMYSVLRDIVHTANKRMQTRICDMETDETWTGGAADTDHYREGEQSIKVTSTGSYATSAIALSSALDLSSHDYIDFDYYIDDASVCAGVRLRLGNSALTSYYEKEITAGFVTGWNSARVAKADFSSTGSPSWSAIQGVQVAGDATGSNTVYVSFDDIRAVDAEAFTMNGVIVGETVSIESARFTYRTISECIKRLANVISYDWYVDADKDLHFFSSETNTAPFELTDMGGTYKYDSLEIENDIANLRNVVYVFGGDAQEGSTQTEFLDSQANGSNKIFQLGYRYGSYSLTVAGVSKTVGVEGEDDASSFDALYNVDEKTLKFATAPASAAAVRFTGYRLYPLKQKIVDAVSATEYGEHEMVIKDDEITTTDAAIQRALAEFVAYADSVVDGSFETDEAGLRVGQKIHVQSDLRALDDWYVIQKVSGRMRTESEMTYQVQLVSTKTWGMVEVLQKLLLKDVKDLDDYDDNHILSVGYDVVRVSESAEISFGTVVEEEIAAGETNYYWMSQPMAWVAGNHAPSSLTGDLNRTPCADGGAILAS